MRKITKCTGEGQGSCTRCTENGKWNRTWMCFLNEIEGFDGRYCNDCTKELVKYLEQFEPKPITEENSSVRKCCPSISWMYNNCEDCDQNPVQCYNKGRCIYEEKHNEFQTDISQNGTQFRLTFITNDKNNFLATQDLARKCIDGEDVLSLETRLAKLEAWREMTRIQQKVMSLFSNMHYGKIGSKEVDYEYYRMKLNEIFDSGSYQDTDSVKQDGLKADTTFVDESWKEDARRRGEKV